MRTQGDGIDFFLKHRTSDIRYHLVMSHDASAAASSPMTNGTGDSQVNREADASSTSSSLADICAELHTRVTRFLNVESESEQVKRTQEQARISIQVIEKALQSYEYAAAHIRGLPCDVHSASCLLTGSPASKHSPSRTMVAKTVLSS